MHTSGRVEQAIAKLRETGNIYEKDGATWLRTTEFGDDKDRVVIKSDGNAGLHRRRPRLLPGQAPARLRPVHLHARRRPPRLHRPAQGRRRGARRRPGHRRGAHRPDGQPGARRPAGADEQAGGHRHHPRRPGRGHRRRRRAVRADPQSRSTRRIDIDLELWSSASSREPGLLRAIRARPAVGAGAQRRRTRDRRRHRRISSCSPTTRRAR